MNEVNHDEGCSIRLKKSIQEQHPSGGSKNIFELSSPKRGNLIIFKTIDIYVQNESAID